MEANPAWTKIDRQLRCDGCSACGMMLSDCVANRCERMAFSLPGDLLAGKKQRAPKPKRAAVGRVALEQSRKDSSAPSMRSRSYDLQKCKTARRRPPTSGAPDPDGERRLDLIVATEILPMSVQPGLNAGPPFSHGSRWLPEIGAPRSPSRARLTGFNRRITPADESIRQKSCDLQCAIPRSRLADGVPRQRATRTACSTWPLFRPPFLCVPAPEALRELQRRPPALRRPRLRSWVWLREPGRR